MPGPLLHLGATVLCAHGGQATPSAPVARVLVSGQPVATQAAPWLVAGCAFSPPQGNGPCITAQWVVAATRVFAAGQPVLLMSGQAVCTPTGTPLVPVGVQTRVLGM
ncbi:hypothetical protein [Alicycliphilus denitrificans]|uniref:DUF4280 domain-containing protein n=1 Tax=Alicycliphilus denitrificans TaxID=179636 RepID=A0A420KFG6_9BURK|nr:hypothetical protein [Alicycliphilus denitrificans]RKJ98694.1 hypothetical protein CE154_002725 [Alicycliphilus denitrificans]